MDSVEYMNSFCRWSDPPPPSPQWESALANACNVIVDRDRDIDRLRRILSHIPGMVALKAKEAAGFGTAVHTIPVISQGVINGD